MNNRPSHFILPFSAFDKDDPICPGCGSKNLNYLNYHEFTCMNCGSRISLEKTGEDIFGTKDEDTGKYVYKNNPFHLDSTNGKECKHCHTIIPKSCNKCPACGVDCNGILKSLGIGYGIIALTIIFGIIGTLLFLWILSLIF